MVPGEEPAQPRAAYEPAPNPFANAGAGAGNVQVGSFADLLTGLLRNVAGAGVQQFPGAEAQPQAEANGWAAFQQEINNLRNRYEQQAGQAPNQAQPGFVQYQIPLNQLFNFNMAGGGYVAFLSLSVVLFFLI